MSPELPSEKPLTIEVLKNRLRFNEINYRTKDRANIALGEFACAALFALDNLPFFRRNIEDTLLHRMDLTPAHAIKLLERSYQHVYIGNDPSYHGYDTAEQYVDSFHEIDSDYGASGTLAFNLLSRTVQSNISERYKTIKLLALLYRERFGNNPSMFDIGTSVKHGPKKLAYNRSGDDPCVPFGDIVVNETIHPHNLDPIRLGEKRPTLDPYTTRLANLALSDYVPFGSMMSFDLTNIDDPENHQWAKSCSFYPNELADPERVQEFEDLEKLDPHHKRIRYMRGDYTSTHDVRELRKVTNDERYDIIFASAVFYMLSPHERHAMIVNASQQLTENGIFVLQDAPNGNFEQPYNYTTEIKDSLRPDLRNQTILRWKTARCKEVALETGKMYINGHLQTIDQAMGEVVEI